MKKYPKLMEMALVIDNKGDLTATTVRDQYQVTFSEEGTNRRRTEQQAFAWWLDLLQDLEGKQIVICSRNMKQKKLTQTNLHKLQRVCFICVNITRIISFYVNVSFQRETTQRRYL